MFGVSIGVVLVMVYFAYKSGVKNGEDEYRHQEFMKKMDNETEAMMKELAIRQEQYRLTKGE